MHIGSIIRLDESQKENAALVEIVGPGETGVVIDMAEPLESLPFWWVRFRAGRIRSDFCLPESRVICLVSAAPGMQSIVDDVTAFHRACDVPVLDGPQIPSGERQALRSMLIEEEVNKELLPALLRGDLPAIADGIADAIYVLVGTAIEYGIPLADVWQAVQLSNMAKVDPVTGKVRKREDGKVLKPEGWKAPDIERVLLKALRCPAEALVAT